MNIPKKLLSIIAGSVLALPLLFSTAQAETVRWATESDVTTLDPHAFFSGPNMLLLHQMYDTLVVRQPDGSLGPSLATSWKMLESDPKIWEFKLREGVKFHDGSPFTAQDVIFSLTRARGQFSQIRAVLAAIDTMTAPDSHTVHIHTKGPNLVFPQSLGHVFIMSEAWSKANNAETTQDTSSKTENGVTRAANGTGAYTLVSREEEAKTIMRANPEYWGKGEFPMEITEIVYLPIRSAATRMAALLSGEVDITLGVPAQDVARLKKDPKIRVNDGAENRVILLGLNIGAPELKSSNIKGKNPLADLRVRQAMELAIDRDTLKRTVMRGLSVPTGQLAPPFTNGYDKTFAAYPKADVKRAKALMTEAGYADGFSVAMDCTNDRYVNDEAICTATAGFLGRIGIKVNVTARPLALHSGLVARAETDFYLFGWSPTTYDSNFIFDYLVHTRGKNSRGSNNATGYSNPELDEKIVAMDTEIDKTKRDALIKSIWEVVQKERFYIPLHYQVLHVASIPKINVQLPPEPLIHFKKIKFEK